MLYEFVNNLILEGVESKNMALAKHYLYDNKGMDEANAMKFIGAIKHDIPNSRLGKCKFILAIVRMAVNGEFGDANTINMINRCLYYAASEAHIEEYDNNLNGMSASEFIDRFRTIGDTDLSNDKEELSKLDYSNSSNYDIVRIDSFDDAESYGEYVDWCITYDYEAFSNYTNNGENAFYFCLRKDYEEIDCTKGKNCPLDDYGLSMIAVSVRPDGSPNTITCRWNHDNGGNDSVMTPKELSYIIGRNFYEVFKPLTPEDINANKSRIFEVAMDEVRYQLSFDEPDQCCDAIYEYDPSQGDTIDIDCYAFGVEEGYIIADKDGDPIIKEIFSYVGEHRYGDVICVRVCGDDAFLRVDGTYVLKPHNWSLENHFNLGFGLINDYPMRSNLVDKDGNWLFDEWVYSVYVPDIAKGMAFSDGSEYEGDIIVCKESRAMYLYTLKEHRFKPTMFKYFEGYGNAIYLLTKPNDNFIVYDIVSGKQIMAGYGVRKGYNRNNGLHWFEMDDGKLYAVDIDGNIVDINSGKIVWENPYE